MITWLDIANFVFVVLTFLAGSVTAIVAIVLAFKANKFARERAAAEDERSRRDKRLEFSTKVISWYHSGSAQPVVNGRFSVDPAWRSTEKSLRVESGTLESGASKILDLVTLNRELIQRTSDPSDRAYLTVLTERNVASLITTWVESPQRGAMQLDIAHLNVRQSLDLQAKS